MTSVIAARIAQEIALCPSCPCGRSGSRYPERFPSCPATIPPVEADTAAAVAFR